MRLARARIQNYRSIKDSGWFDLENDKSILVGPNEAGKTALLRALEHVSPGPLVKPFEALRDYPRSEYWQIQNGERSADQVMVAEAIFELEDEDRAAVAAIASGFEDIEFYRGVRLDNTYVSNLRGAPPVPRISDHADSLRRLGVHCSRGAITLPVGPEEPAPTSTSSDQLETLLGQWSPDSEFTADIADQLRAWLDATAAPLVDELNATEMNRLRALREMLQTESARTLVLEEIRRRRPTFVYFSVYTRVKPMLHLRHLADAIEASAIDESDPYNFGNYCLLKLLNFSARELSDLGSPPDPGQGDAAAFEAYRGRLDERDAILNSASLRLTQQIRQVWDPEEEGSATPSDYVIRISADQQYLKVSVEDSLGVAVELDQRSEGFQWLVSFFVVFFAQTKDDLSNAVLLLDEPGVSLHGLKQRAFRLTLSKLAVDNQLIFTTHSPFLVGPNELDLVRVVEMADRSIGTQVHNDVVATNPASLLPLQEALGYDMAQSLFVQQRNLILEGLTDFWYIESVSEMLREAGLADLDPTIALVPANSAGKVVYFATILHAHSLKVAALLDSDSAGDSAANQDTLVHTLGNRAILRTKDVYTGAVAHPEIEDLLRESLVSRVGGELGWDVTAEAGSQPSRGVVGMFTHVIGEQFSKYKLAKAFVRWTRDHSAADLAEGEREQWVALIDKINAALQ